MKKFAALLCVLISGFSYNVKAQSASEIYAKLLVDCKELKDKKFIYVNCEKLNVLDLREEVKKAIQKMQYEEKVKELELAYTPIKNDLNIATVYSDFAKICEDLQKQIKNATFGETCKLPEKCWESSIEILRQNIIDCLNIVVPVTKDCKVWFEEDHTSYKDTNFPFYSMKLNKKSINELFVKRLLNKVIDNDERVASMDFCGITKNEDINIPEFGSKFKSRPVINVSGYGTSNLFYSMKNTIDDNYFYSEVKHYGFADGKEFLNWIQSCFVEILGDKILKLKLDKKTNCWKQ